MVIPTLGVHTSWHSLKEIVSILSIPRLPLPPKDRQYVPQFGFIKPPINGRNNLLYPSVLSAH